MGDRCVYQPIAKVCSLFRGLSFLVGMAGYTGQVFHPHTCRRVRV